MTRDDEDRILGVRLRTLRQARGVPAASPGDPADEDLLLYLDGALLAAGRRRLEARLAGSPLARDRLGIVTQALSEAGEARSPAAPEAEPGGLVRLVFLVARDALQFLRGDLLPVAVAGAGVVRGGGPAAPPTFCEFATVMGDVTVALALDCALGSVDARLVLTTAGHPVNDARVTVRRQGRAVASVPSEVDGSIVVRVPPEGLSILELHRRGTIIGQLSLDLSHPLPA